jgi:hypothetical protein
MTCSRCKAVTASNGHVQDHPMLDVMRAAVGREQPNNITVNPPSIHFETGAFRIAATDLSPMAELAGSITELAARPAPVNEIRLRISRSSRPSSTSTCPSSDRCGSRSAVTPKATS